MADARYIVEIILQARDQTAEAFASATGRQEDLNRMQEESARHSEEMREADRRMGAQLLKTREDLIQSQKDLNLSSNEGVRAQVALEEATKRYVRTSTDARSSDAQRTVALGQMVEATKGLGSAIKEANKADEEWTTARARGQAERIRNANIEREQARQLAASYQEAGRVASASIRQLEQDQARVDQARLARIREYDAAQARSHTQEQARQREAERDEAARATAQQRRLAERQRIEREVEQAAQRLARVDLRGGGREVDEISQKLAKLGQDYERTGASANRFARLQQDAMRNVRRDIDGLEKQYLKFEQAMNRAREAEKRRVDAITEGDRFVEIEARIQTGEALREAGALRSELNAILSHVAVDVDLDLSPGDVARVEGIMAGLSRDRRTELKIDVDRSAFSAINAIKGAGTEIANNFTNAGNSLAAFDNILRGMLSLGITAFLSNLITLAGAAAGAFLALAGSAAMAGAAIGGALVAGITQAIPVLGVLITAIQRVKAVTDAVQQANLLQQQGGQQRQQQASQEMQQAEQLRAAQERIRDAQERVAESQENLTRARRDAVREVEALTLAQRGNVLSLKEAREEERLAIQEGRAQDLARARLAIDEARARVGGGARELTAARAGRTPAVESATEQLEASQEALDDARRSAVQTRREVAAASTDLTSGANKLNFLMAQLSDAEKGLFQAVKRLQNVWREFSQEVSAPLIESFTGAVNGIVDLLGQPRILNAARSLSSAMADQFDRIFAAFTDNESIEQFLRIAEQAADNLKPLTDIAIDVGEAFMDIGEAAGPALEKIIGWIADAADNFADFMDETRRSGELGSFFEDAADHLKGWIDLLVSIGRIFIAIFGPAGGAQTGLGLIKDLTEAFNDFADQVGTKGTKANDFFRDLFTVMQQTIEAFGPVFEALGEGLADLFGKEAGQGGAGIEGFATILADVLIPAFFNFLDVMRNAVIAVGEFVEQHPLIARMAAVVLSFVGALTVFGRLGALIAPVFKAFQTLDGLFARLLSKGEATKLLFRQRFAIGGIGLAIGAIVLLLDKLGLLDDAWDSVKTGFQNAVDAIKPAIDDLKESFDGLSDALSGGGGLVPVLTTVFEALFVVIEELGGGIGRMIGGTIRAFAGFIDVLTGILTLDLGKILEGVGKIWTGMMTVLINPFVTAFRIIDRLLGGWLSKIGNALADVVSFIVDWGVDIFKVLTFPIRKALGFIFDILGDVLPFLGRIFGAVIRFLVNLGIDIFVAITSPFRRAIRTAINIIRGLIGVARSVFNAVLDFLIDVGGKIFDAIRDPIRNAVRRVGTIIGGIWDVIKEALGDAASKVGEIFGGVASAITGAFDGVVGVLTDIWNAIIGVAVDGVNFMIDAINKVIDLAEKIPGAGKLVPNKIDKLNKSGFQIDEPEGPARYAMIGRRQEGGRIGGSYGGGDRIPILAEEGEFMIRKEAVSFWGMGVMDFINRAGGRLFGRGARGMHQLGAEPTRRPEAGGEAETEQVREQTRDMMVLIRRFGRAAIEEWRDIFTRMERITRRSMNDIEDEIDKSLRRVLRIVDSAGHRINRNWNDTMRNMMRSTFIGFDYIRDASKEALEAFDAKVPSMSIPRPKDLTRASGGWVGQPGERGGDNVPVWMGRGEAVLNWAHQKVVEPAMHAVYGFGLAEMFDRTKAMHAGGQQRGYMAGGFTGPDGSGEGFTPTANFAKSKFGLTMTSGKASHSMMSQSGNVSEHYLGQAGDFSNGVLTPQEDAFSNFWLTKASQVISQLIWRNKDQQQGFFVSGHEDHVHLALLKQYAFNADLMARIISRASRGLSIQDLLRGNLSGDNIDVEHVSKIDVEGKGSLADLVQKVISKVREAANKFIDKRASKLIGSPGTPQHGDYDGPLDKIITDPGVVLSENQIMELARKAGLPPITFLQIAQGESGYRPAAHGYDPGGTEGLGLWQITTGYNDELIAKYGGMQAMFNPWRNAQAAYELFVAAGRTIQPWYGTKYVTDFTPPYQARGGFVGGVPQYAKGGELPGGEGEPMPIVAHSGEWILNRGQQSRLASWMGTTSGQIKRLLGFTGKASGGFFQDGGEVPATLAARERLRRQDIRSRGIYRLPETLGPLSLMEFGELAREAGRVFTALRVVRTKSKPLFNRITMALEAMTKEGGLLDELAANTEEFIAQLQTNLLRRQFRRGRGGAVIQRARLDTPAEQEQANLRIAQQVANRLRENLQIVNGVFQRTERRLASTNRQIKALERGGLDEDEEKEHGKLVDFRKDLEANLVNLDERRRDFQSRYLESLQAQAEAAQAIFEARAERTGRRGERLEQQRAVQEALGLGGTQEGFNLAGQQIEAMRAQQNQLRTIASRARGRGLREFASQIESQIRDLNAQIAQATVQLVRDRVDAVNAAFERQSARLDLSERLAQVRQGLGDAIGAAQARRGILALRGQGLAGQQAALQALLPEAQAAGNIELIRELEDQLAELSTQIVENTLAQRDATTAYRQVQIDLISQRGAFRGGLFGQLGTILQSVATLTGGDTTRRQIEIAQAALTELIGTGGGLRQILAETFGIDLRGLTGGGFVDAFQAAMGQFDSILAGLSEAERSQFESLINAIVENEAAVNANTQQLQELEGTVRDPQSFSSSAWQWFREAVFTGMGDVLPQYQVPGMQGGGFVTRSGLFNLHAGEFVVNPRRPGGQAVPAGDTNITINEAGRPIDMTHLTNRLAFARKNNV